MENRTICPLSMAGPQPRECAKSCEFCPPADWAELGNIWKDLHAIMTDGIAAEVSLRVSDRAIPVVAKVTDATRGRGDGGR